MEQKHDKRLMSLIQSVRVLNSTRDLDNVLDQLVREVFNVIAGANASILFLYDKRAEVLYAKTANGFNMEYMKHIQLKPGEGMSGKTFLAGKGQIFSTATDIALGMENISSLTKDIYAQSLGDMKYPTSAICVPLLSNHQCLGVLTVDMFEKDITFGDIDLQLLESFACQAAIAIENATLLSQNERTHRILEELSRVSLAKGDIEDITKSLARLIDKQVVVFNEILEVVALSDTQFSRVVEQLKRKRDFLLKGEISSMLFSLDDASYVIYVFPIRTELRRLGLLCIITEENKELDSLYRFAIEQANLIFAMEMDRQERALAEDFINSRAILEHLIHSPYDELSTTHLANFNFPDLEYHHYIVVQLYIKNPLVALKDFSLKKQHLMRMIYRELSRLSYKTLVYEQNMEVTLMFTVSSMYEEEKVYTYLKELFQKINGVASSQLCLTSLIGFGRVVHTLNDVQRSYQDAKSCVQYLQNTCQLDQMLTYRQLGSYRLFLKTDRKELKEYASSVLGMIEMYDKKHDKELLKTLKVYLETNQSMTESAKQLYVHVNTIKYRLKTIANLLGYDKLTGRKAFELQLGLHIIEYLEG